MNRYRNAKIFEAWLTEKQLHGNFEMRNNDNNVVFSLRKEIKGQIILHRIEFYDNTIYIELYFTNIKSVDIQTRFQLLELCNRFNCQSYRRILKIDGDQDLNLTFFDQHGEIELNPEWVVENVLKSQEEVEKIIPEVMKIIWS